MEAGAGFQVRRSCEALGIESRGREGANNHTTGRIWKSWGFHMNDFLAPSTEVSKQRPFCKRFEAARPAPSVCRSFGPPRTLKQATLHCPGGWAGQAGVSTSDYFACLSKMTTGHTSILTCTDRLPLLTGNSENDIDVIDTRCLTCLSHSRAHLLTSGLCQ